MDENIKSVLHKVIQLSKQNSEFDSELRKALGIAPSAIVSSFSEEKMNQIYEYCIEEIIKKQAHDFYSGFPISAIIPTLEKDFVRMENFRRKDSFGDFCLALYQQIECMTNSICENKDLDEITKKMWAQSAYVKTGENITPSISNRTNSDYVIAKLVFLKDPVEKSRSSLQSQAALDKIRTIVYFLGYQGMMKNSDYDNYYEVTSLLSDIYQCRNMNHRGNTLREYEQKTLDRILPLKSYYYFKFMGVLAIYLDYIKNGYHNIDNLLHFAKKLPDKRVELIGPKILDKIELSEKDKNKKRFNN